MKFGQNQCHVFPTFLQHLRLCRIHIDRGSTKASPRAVWLLWIIMRLSLMERNVTHLPHVSYIVTFDSTLHRFVIHCHHYHNCHIDVTHCDTVSHIYICYTIIMIIVQSLHNIIPHICHRHHRHVYVKNFCQVKIFPD